jgi:thiol-disulfide isomerase/thioredoxin
MPMSRRHFVLALPALPVAVGAATRADEMHIPEPLAPEFTAQDARDWINSTPLRWQNLEGRVVLLDVWTFECWNCYRSFPWLNTLQTRFAPHGLAVIGIHSPEFDGERDRARVRAKVREFGLKHPVMLDNDLRYWQALGNEYWPAFYVVDRHRHLRGRFYGETHAGDAQAVRIESRLARLLAEPM